MTDVSEQGYNGICKYCGNCTSEKKCLADVPWYCCSINCKFWTEPDEKEPPKKRPPSMRRIMKKTLVETF
jgi:hypothetical protein